MLRTITIADGSAWTCQETGGLDQGQPGNFRRVEATVSCLPEGTTDITAGVMLALPPGWGDLLDDELAALIEERLPPVIPARHVGKYGYRRFQDDEGRQVLAWMRHPGASSSAPQLEFRVGRRLFRTGRSEVVRHSPAFSIFTAGDEDLRAWLALADLVDSL